MKPANNKKITAENILFIRNELGLTQPEFGELINANKQKVYYYENELTTPKPPILNKIADIAHVSVEALISKKLTRKDIKVDLKNSKLTPLSQMQILINVLIEVKAQNIVIMKNQNFLLSKALTQKKYLEIVQTNDRELKAEFEKIKSNLYKF